MLDLLFDVIQLFGLRISNSTLKRFVYCVICCW